jgi:hypothetical protein
VSVKQEQIFLLELVFLPLYLVSLDQQHVQILVAVNHLLHSFLSELVSSCIDHLLHSLMK